LTGSMTFVVILWSRVVVLTAYIVLTVNFTLQIYDVKLVPKQRGTQGATVTAHMKLSDDADSVHEGA
jgi:hypothetical protein